MKEGMRDQVKLGGIMAAVLISTSFFLAMITGVLDVGDDHWLPGLSFLVAIATCVNYFVEKRKIRQRDEAE